MLLILEDDPALCTIWNDLCNRFDFSAVIVPSASEALAAVARSQHAALIVDLDSIAPGEIDSKFIEELRGLERNLNRRGVPVIAAYSSVESKIISRNFIDAFLQKPFEPEEFRKILLRWAYQPHKPNLKILPNQSPP